MGSKCKNTGPWQKGALRNGPAEGVLKGFSLQAWPWLCRCKLVPLTGGLPPPCYSSLRASWKWCWKLMSILVPPGINFSHFLTRVYNDLEWTWKCENRAPVQARAQFSGFVDVRFRLYLGYFARALNLLAFSAFLTHFWSHVGRLAARPWGVIFKINLMLKACGSKMRTRELKRIIIWRNGSPHEAKMIKHGSGNSSKVGQNDKKLPPY